MTESALIDADRCRFLVKQDEITDDAAEEGFQFLSKLREVIDVECDDASRQINALLP